MELVVSNLVVEKLEERFCVDARRLHEFVESKRKYTDWFKARIEDADLVEGRDYTLSQKNEVNIIDKFQEKVYLVTLSTAKELCMLERNTQGKMARKYFIECEEKLQSISQKLLPGDLPTALRALADAEEQKLKLVKEVEIADKRAYTSMGKLGGTVTQLNQTREKLNEATDEINRLQFKQISHHVRLEIEKLAKARAKELGGITANIPNIYRAIKTRLGLSRTNAKWYHMENKDIELIKDLIKNFK